MAAGYQPIKTSYNLRRRRNLMAMRSLARRIVRPAARGGVSLRRDHRASHANHHHKRVEKRVAPVAAV